MAAVLTELEFQERVALVDVTTYLQRAEMVVSLSQLIERHIVELGSEGRLVELQRESWPTGSKRTGRLSSGTTYPTAVRRGSRRSVGRSPHYLSGSSFR